MSKRNWLKHLGFTTTAAIAVSKINTMEQNNITTDDMNEAVAIFDGWVKRNPREFVKDGYMRYIWEFKYHERWDELMPIIEKIETVEMNGGRVVRTAADVKIFYQACIIEYSPDGESGDPCEDETTIQTQGESKLEAVYKAVYQFITWLNQQNTAKEIFIPDLEYRGPSSHCKACEDEAKGIKIIMAARHTCRKRRTNEK